jgi:FkbM family methyltransferase
MISKGNANMTQKYESFITECQALPSPNNGLPILIYGAGSKGRETAKVLQNQGARVVAFLDAKAQPEQHLDDLPVFTLTDWLSHNDPTHYGVIIAIGNMEYWTDGLLLARSLPQQGFAWCSHFRYFCPLSWDHVMKASVPWGYESSYEALDRLNSILDDEKSRQCLEEIVRARITLSCPQNCTDNLYIPNDLPSWPSPLRFVDCGAYTGDTLADFALNGYLFEAIAVFEPDPFNFSQLIRNTSRDKNITRLPCALGARTENVIFQVNKSMGSRIIDVPKEKGGEMQSVLCVALDDVLPTFAPNLIKMDIEGAEYDALLGARHIIERYRPSLAISIYHCRDHLWTIPFLLESWKLCYRLHIRYHTCTSTDIVLYAFPTE